jgi:hypothetical protein
MTDIVRAMSRTTDWTQNIPREKIETLPKSAEVEVFGRGR